MTAAPTAKPEGLVAAIIGRGRDLPWLQLVAVVVVYLVTVAIVPGASGWRSITSILVLASFVGLASAGQTFAALLGGLDLSIPAVIGMANVFICELTGAHAWPFAFAAALLLLIAAVVGAFNGFVSKRFTIHPLLITIGVGAILTGVVRAIGPNGGKATAAPPAWLQAFASPGQTTGFVPVPPVVLLWLLAAILIGLLLTRTSFGRHMYATGSSPRAADLARVDTTAVWMKAFALSSVFAAITGIMLAGFADQGAMTLGDPYLFLTIACVVLGGTTLQGGRGDYWRTVLGTLILTEFTLLFNGLNVDSTTLQILLGIVMMVVVAVYGREEHIRNRV
jgi:ribose transport system permease protein